MLDNSPPAAIDDASPASWAAFRVDNPTEIASLLRQLRDDSVPLVLSTPAGLALVTTLWSLDTQQGRLNFTGDDTNPQLAQLAEADEAVCVGYLDSVKLQFDLHDLLLVRGPRSCALQTSSPTVMYRFQRRNAFRVRTLERYSPTARLRHPAIPDMRLALRVLDVSIGGCALLVPNDVPSLEPGLVLHGVQVELDSDTRFSTSMQIQHIGSINSQPTGLRAGCEWRSIGRESERALQRYIDQTQKRRRLLSMD